MSDPNAPSPNDPNDPNLSGRPPQPPYRAMPAASPAGLTPAKDIEWVPTPTSVGCSDSRLP